MTKIPASDAPSLGRCSEQQQIGELLQNVGDLLSLRQLPSCSWSRRTKGRQHCGKWQCHGCAFFMGQEWTKQVFSGLLWASSRNLHARILHISAPGGPTVPDVATFNRSWNLCMRDLGRAGLAPDAYLWALGGPGRLHRHVIMLGGSYLHPSKLEKVANSGHGNIVVEHIGPSLAEARRRANYIGRNGTTYALLPRARPGTRLRPFYASRHWPRRPARPGGSSHARR